MFEGKKMYKSQFKTKPLTLFKEDLFELES